MRVSGQVRLFCARRRASMTGPGWLAAVFAGLMLLIATCCTIRLGLWRLRGRAADPQADTLHVLMGVAMAGMLEPKIATFPDSVWLAVFTVAAAWFGWQAIRAHSRSGLVSVSCAHPAPHAVECAAMLYMLMPSRSAMTMPGMGGRGFSANPALTLVLALFMLGYIVWTADQLTTLSRARALTASGQRRGDEAVALAPRFAACYKIAMSVAMGYMLLAMVWRRPLRCRHARPFLATPARVPARNAGRTVRVHARVKKIGFLSFGHWSSSPGSQTRSASDALLQAIELAVAAEELGADGAYFRVHHFANQLGSPFPLLAAVGARTNRIEIGTAVIDMRYENPLYMAEDAGAADLISGGRLQLGISRGSPEQVIDGWRYFGYAPQGGETDADMARGRAEVLLEVLRGMGFARPNPRPMFANPPGLLRVEPHSPGLRDRIWWGAASQRTAAWAAELGMNMQSSTLITNESDKPFHVQQAEQIQAFRDAWQKAGHEREPRVSVSRSIFALVDDQDRLYFGRRNQDADEVGLIDAQTEAIFGRTYAAEPDVLIRQLKEDTAIAAADTLLLTVPNQLGVDYNAHVIDSILTHVAPALGWR
jgi:alkanesulfonate monooxygenase SsuD/methylene tetrahydromethanopterin reductase-like flavin-dependent oxidoreductase (luciferase family)